MDNRPRWRYPAGVDEKGEVEVEVEVADSEVEVVTAVEEEEAVSVTEATRAAMHAEREVTLPGTVIRAEDPVMGLGAGTLDPDADQTTEGMSVVWCCDYKFLREEHPFQGNCVGFQEAKKPQT